MNKFTAQYFSDTDCWNIYCNGNLFANVFDSDFDTFREFFKAEIEVIK